MSGTPTMVEVPTAADVCGILKDMVQTGPHVYRAIAATSAALAKVGIGKTRQNDQQGYKFRGIDEVLNALAPALSAAGLVILPRMTDRTVTERVTPKGSVLFYTVVRAEFDFVAVVDGSIHTVVTYGEAMDSGDKSTNKAMSAAYKYAAFQAFCIPLEGMAADADQTTHEAVLPVVPEHYAEIMDGLRDVAVQGMAALRATWNDVPEVVRTYATKQDKAAWEAIKASADAADARAKKGAKS